MCPKIEALYFTEAWNIHGSWPSEGDGLFVPHVLSSYTSGRRALRDFETCTHATSMRPVFWSWIHMPSGWLPATGISQSYLQQPRKSLVFSSTMAACRILKCCWSPGGSLEGNVSTDNWKPWPPCSCKGVHRRVAGWSWASTAETWTASVKFNE